MSVTGVSQGAGHSGPVVQIDILGDGHFEPDTVETINLGIENFSGWHGLNSSSLVSVLSAVADREAVIHEYCGNERCKDPQYLAGLAEYLSTLKSEDQINQNLLRSALLHGLHRGAPSDLRIQVAGLFEHKLEGVREIACRYAEQIPGDRRSLVNSEACEAIAQSLTSAPEKFQPTLINILSRSGAHQNSEEVIRSVIQVGQKCSTRDVLDQAVIFLQNKQGPNVDVIMQRCFGDTWGSYAAGIAAVYLLKKNPDDMRLREAIATKMDRPEYWLAQGVGQGYALGPYCHALLKSGFPAAVAVALDAVDMSAGYLYHGFRPIAYLGKLVADWRAENQQEKDLNTIMFHLSTGFQPDAAAYGVQVLADSGSPRAIRFLEKQLKNPPNYIREAVLRSVLKGNPA